METATPIITYDYDASPYGQKIRTMLALSGLPHQRCEVPALLPRPQLESMGITYRRIPLLAVGKDVYCDSSLITSKILELQGSHGKLHKHPADAAFEQWGNWAFQTGLPLVPTAILSPEFVKDRETIFPILKRSDLAQLRTSAIGAFASLMKTIEEDFLSSGYPYIGGRKEPSTADVHVAWSIRWFCSQLGVDKEPGLDAESYPRTYAWFKSLPGEQPETIDAEQSRATILRSEYRDKSLQNQSNDPLQSLVKKEVMIESADTTPGAHPQNGKLISVSIHESAIELENGIRMHFPRAGYYVKPR